MAAATVPVPYEHIVAPGQVFIGGTLAFAKGDAIPLDTAKRYKIEGERGEASDAAPDGPFADVAVVVTETAEPAQPAAPATDTPDPTPTPPARPRRVPTEGA